MKARTWILLTVLLLAFGAALTGLIRTRDTGGAFAAIKPATTKKGTPVAPDPLNVDEQPIRTAKALLPLATTPEEESFAKQAVRLANHEVDLAFSDALRQAVDTPLKLSPEAKEAQAAKTKAEDVVEGDQRRLAQLLKQLAKAPESQKDALEDQVEVAKAQLELDQDELEEASDDLEAAGGDPQAKIKRLKAAHEAAAKDAPALPPESEWGIPKGSLFAKARTWWSLRHKASLLAQAREQSAEKGEHLKGRRQSWVKRVAGKKEDRAVAKEKAAGFSARAASAEESRTRKKEALGDLKAHMAEQRTLASLGKRVQDQEELADVYGRWGLVVADHQRSALHSMLESLLVILGVILVVILGSHLAEGMFDRKVENRTKTATLKTLVPFALRVVGLIVVVLVVIGVPAQTTTVLGLAGAGLTVAMKDFIVAFFGWFVLMGKNGLRVGDWVEIKGVGGEVVEIGLLRTILLETGSWSDSAHPTGRRVAFVNSFAIEGHFFNFSTSGQWMWDELKAVIPTSQDPYPVIAGIQKLVETQTEANAKQAESEWQSATKRYKVQAFSTVPGIHVSPVAGGIEIRVRYITRAYESSETRKTLNQAVVDLLQGKA